MAVSNPELEALNGLLESEGWRLLTGWIDQEWGAVGFAAKVGGSIADPNMNPQIAIAQLQQAVVAQKAVLGVKDWPAQRVQQIKRQAMQAGEPSLSRRGPGL